MVMSPTDNINRCDEENNEQLLVVNDCTTQFNIFSLIHDHIGLLSSEPRPKSLF